MPTLASDLRSKLERVVVEARDVAEAGARAALEALAVHEPRYYPHMSAEEQRLRNQLRARARQLGDKQEPGGQLGIEHLASECAYEHWHRMLFARFLAENELLIESESGMAVSLAEAEELAKEAGEDVWTFASRCAERMLPQIFRPDDPLLHVSLATEHRLKLEKLLDSLPPDVFAASDALGWVYQFWQSKKKDEINRSEVKIGADEIGPVTQLFTEPYMVQFLLDNTLGAWWAGKNLTSEDAETTESEQELRQKLALPGVPWDYLRLVRGADGEGGPWRPAAGTFDGWPKTAKEITVLDPCCGSGHFLVAALQHLVPMRMAEEGLSAPEAVDAVLRDNIHGLEIDERCCQIAAFALAFAAWTYPGAGGYRLLPEMQVACSGIGPQCSEQEWLRLAEQAGMPAAPVQRERIKNGLLNLHRLFSDAPTLGSLIDPKSLQEDLRTADYETIQPYLIALLRAEQADDATRERAIAAAGIVEASYLLGGVYALITTNVPFLARGKQSDPLKTHIEDHYRDAKQDLATAFLERLVTMCATCGAVALVTPQNWHYLTSYRHFRETLLRRRHWHMIARLGPAAFQNMNWWAATTQLSIISEELPAPGAWFADVDASKTRITDEKQLHVRQNEVTLATQEAQLRNPDARIAPDLSVAGSFLQDCASCLQGLATADYSRFGRCFWDVPPHCGKWAYQQSTVLQTCEYGGAEHMLYWEGGQGELARNPQARIQGLGGLGVRGVAVSQMNRLCSTLYTGELFDNNTAVIIPANADLLPAIWVYCSSPSFLEEVRKIDKSTAVTNATLVKVPFDLAHWQQIARVEYPDGLPEPESDDPTQWLFHGRPEESTAPLQVAVTRLLGYRWPAELDDKMRLSRRARDLVAQCDELAQFADPDGIVCIPSVRGEEPAAQRLEALLTAAGVDAAKVRELTDGCGLDEWLRNAFFEEHCKLFHDRPFIWHIWDGRKRDGFHALVNCHKLCEGDGKGRKLLESLTYSYLGDWIGRQEDGVRRGEEGAEDRLAAVLELRKQLEAILEGEPPFDIFVRWKPLAEQPIGWEPDINDGVRLNIRPFLASDLPNGKKGAGILRSKPNIKWAKDRGKEPNRPKADYPWFWGWDEKTEDFAGGEPFDGNRWNDCHYTRRAKQAARDTAKEEGRR